MRSRDPLQSPAPTYGTINAAGSPRDLDSSASLPETGHRAVFVLLLILAAILFGAELFARLVDQHSKVQTEVNREHAEALTIRPGGPHHPRQLLIVGNSFAGMDLDVPVLQQRLSPEWGVRRYAVYNTWYNDWYYGVKRLLEEGSHPDAIALTLVASNITSSAIRGDYSAYYLFQPQDLAALARDAQLDNTETANLLFARYSRFYGLRSEIRKFLLQQILRDLPRMYDLLHPLAGKPLSSPDVLALIKPRLERLQELTSRHGVRLLLIVPPLPRAGQEFHAELSTAARAAGIPIVMPYSCGDLPTSVFVDNVHLSPAGAARFSQAIVPELRRALTTNGDHARRGSRPTASGLDRNHA